MDHAESTHQNSEIIPHFLKHNQQHPVRALKFLFTVSKLNGSVVFLFTGGEKLLFYH